MFLILYHFAHIYLQFSNLDMSVLLVIYIYVNNQSSALITQLPGLTGDNRRMLVMFPLS